MSRVFWLFLGLLAGAVAVVVAQRSPRGRDLVGRVDQSLQTFLDGVSEGYREQSR